MRIKVSILKNYLRSRKLTMQDTTLYGRKMAMVKCHFGKCK